MQPPAGHQVCLTISFILPRACPGLSCAGALGRSQQQSRKDQRSSLHPRLREPSRDGRAASAVAGPSLHSPGEKPSPQDVTRTLRPKAPASPRRAGGSLPRGVPPIRVPPWCSGSDPSSPATGVGNKLHLRLSIFPFPWKPPGCSIPPVATAGPGDAEHSRTGPALPVPVLNPLVDRDPLSLKFSSA